MVIKISELLNTSNKMAKYHVNSLFCKNLPLNTNKNPLNYYFRCQIKTQPDKNIWLGLGS